MKAELLLSDEFVAFSAKVNELHAKKKELESEFKNLYTAHKAKLKALDEEALQLKNEFDIWSNSKETK